MHCEVEGMRLFVWRILLPMKTGAPKLTCGSLIIVAQWYFPVVFVIPTVLPAPVFPFAHADSHSTVTVEVTVQQCLVKQMSLHFGRLKMTHTKRVQQRGSFPGVLLHVCWKNGIFLVKFRFLKKKKKRKAFCSFYSLLIIHNFWSSPFIFLVWFCSCSSFLFCSVFILFLSFISFDSVKVLFPCGVCLSYIIITKYFHFLLKHSKFIYLAV